MTERGGFTGLRAGLGVLLMLAGGMALASEPRLSGSWQQGGLIVGRVEPGLRVAFNGRPLRVSPDGHFVFGLHRDEAPAAELLLTSADGSVQRFEYTVAQRRYAEQRIDGLPPSQVEPPAQVQARIAEDARQVQAARNLDSALDHFAEGFVWPSQGRLSSVYGSRRILNGVPKQPHYGIDIAAPSGTPVVASAAGVVRLARSDLYYTGGTLIIDHGAGVSSTYLHLSRTLVALGDRVERGQTIGAVGATGRATGPHLCFRFNWFEARLDPQLLLPAQP